jgi:hypothetical protein
MRNAPFGARARASLAEAAGPLGWFGHVVEHGAVVPQPLRRVGFHDNSSASIHVTPSGVGEPLAGEVENGAGRSEDGLHQCEAGPFEANADQAASPKESVSMLTLGRPLLTQLTSSRSSDRGRHSLPSLCTLVEASAMSMWRTTPGAMVGVIQYRRRSSRIRTADRAFHRRRSCSAPGRVHLGCQQA